MKLNSLRTVIKLWEKANTEAPEQSHPKPVPSPPTPATVTYPVHKVAGGVIKWKPVDRLASMMVRKAPWINHPPVTIGAIQELPRKQPKQRIKRKKGKHMESTREPQDIKIPNSDGISNVGIRIVKINGEDMFHKEDLDRLIALECSQLHKETSPMVKSAHDARRVIDELLNGIGGDMEKFKANTKIYLEDIRGLRFCVVQETAAMTKELKDVRQFFLGSDYSDQIKRLREFVELCERLKALKDSGFLDSVADTLIKLT